MRGLTRYLRLSEKFPGWTRGEEAKALARASFSSPEDATIVEIGSFFGSGTILLAGPRKLRGSGVVHAVDPFDGSGDSFSVPHYANILAEWPGRTLREHFEATIAEAQLNGWVRTHQGTAQDVGEHWSTPVDLLFLDGDQSPAGARRAYDAWIPWLKPGGLIALHNSHPQERDPQHEGHWLLVEAEIRAPIFTDIDIVESTTFARKGA